MVIWTLLLHLWRVPFAVVRVPSCIPLFLGNLFWENLGVVIYVEVKRVGGSFVGRSPFLVNICVEILFLENLV